VVTLVLVGTLGAVRLAQPLSIIIQLAMESGKIGFGAEVMMSTVKSSTLITSLTGANQLDVSACSDEALAMSATTTYPWFPDTRTSG